MNFILGMIVGAMVFSSDGKAVGRHDPLSQIPLRCIAALDEGDAAFMECRRLSMMAQLNAESKVYGHDGQGSCWIIWRQRERHDLYDFLHQPARSGCDVDRALKLELAAIRAMEKIIAGNKRQ